MNEISRSSLLSAVMEKGIAIHTEMTVKELNSAGLKARDKEGKEHLFQAGTIILALGSVATTYFGKLLPARDWNNMPLGIA